MAYKKPWHSFHNLLASELRFKAGSWWLHGLASASLWCSSVTVGKGMNECVKREDSTCMAPGDETRDLAQGSVQRQVRRKVNVETFTICSVVPFLWWGDDGVASLLPFLKAPSSTLLPYRNALKPFLLVGKEVVFSSLLGGTQNRWSMEEVHNHALFRLLYFNGPIWKVSIGTGQCPSTGLHKHQVMEMPGKNLEWGWLVSMATTACLKPAHTLASFHIAMCLFIIGCNEEGPCGSVGAASVAITEVISLEMETSTGAAEVLWLTSSGKALHEAPDIVLSISTMTVASEELQVTI